MAVELQPGEAELKRVKDTDIKRDIVRVATPHGEILETEVRVFPAKEGERWVYDRNGDALDKNYETHDWVLIGPGKKQ